ncbi:MAG: discoidin domain-containing protein [Lachnospiraceae bacterium]
MKRKWRQVISGCLIMGMLASYIPVQAVTSDETRAGDKIDLNQMINVDKSVTVSFTGTGTTTQLSVCQQNLFDGDPDTYAELRNGYYDYETGTDILDGSNNGDMVLDFGDNRILVTSAELWARKDYATRLYGMEIYGTNDDIATDAETKANWTAITEKVNKVTSSALLDTGVINYGYSSITDAGTEKQLWSKSTEYYRYIRIINKTNNKGNLSEIVLYGDIKASTALTEEPLELFDYMNHQDITGNVENADYLFDHKVTSTESLSADGDMIFDAGAGAAFQLTKTGIIMGQEYGDALVGAQFFCSADGVEYTRLTEPYETASTVLKEMPVISQEPYRYIKLSVPGDAKARVAEIYLYGVLSGMEDRVSYRKLDNTTGTITGSSANSYVERAWDGNLSTWPELRNDLGESDGESGWTCIEFPDAQEISMIKFHPRNDKPERVDGGYFEASTDGIQYHRIATIERIPAANKYTKLMVFDTHQYKYIRYVGMVKTYLNIADIQVYTYDSVPEAALDASMEELRLLAESQGCDISREEAVVTAAKESGSSEEMKKVYIEINETITELSRITKYDSFEPNIVWEDTDGNMIQAHGGAVMWDEKTQKYYWYGEHKGAENYIDDEKKTAGTPVIGTAVYSSTDLYNWTYEAVALPAFNNPAFSDPDAVIDESTDMYLLESTDEFRAAWEAAKTHTEAKGEEYLTYTDYYTFEQYNKHDIEELNGLYDGLSGDEKKALYKLLNWNMVMERPKVVYNPNNDTYVMWFHCDGYGVGSYNIATGGVAVSDSPTGPFRFIGGADLTVGKENIKPVHGKASMLKDMTLFVDEDGTGYVLHANETNRVLYIEKLTEDYTAVTGEFSRNYVRSNDNSIDSREAPAIFKYHGKYYLVTSGCTGWAYNPAGYSVADELIIDYGDSTSEEAVQHVGPFQHINNFLTNPMIGPDSSTTFKGQSTCIFPVQGKEGCFIYMGDRWNADGLKNSRYQWLPVVIDEENESLSILWADKWNLDDFDRIHPTRKNLSTVIQNYRTLDRTKYSEEALTAFEKVIESAEDMPLDADAEEIVNAIQSLDLAFESVQFSIVEVAKQKADALSRCDYTHASWRRVINAYNKLEKLVQGVATDEEIEAAIQFMDDAISGLVTVTYNETQVDPSSLTATASTVYNSTNQPSCVLDNDDTTIWHSKLGSLSKEADKEYITLEMSTPAEKSGVMKLSYLPRQDENSTNGIITRYSIKISSNGTDFTEVENGMWNGDREEKQVTFRVDEGTKYIRLVAQASLKDNTYASAAEIHLYHLTLPEGSVPEGDANGDGTVDAEDIKHILNVAAGMESAKNDTAADYNGDGSITAVDACMIALDILN